MEGKMKQFYAHSLPGRPKEEWQPLETHLRNVAELAPGVAEGIDKGKILGGKQMEPLVPVEVIEKKILLIRGQKVMLDADLADLYGVETRSLIQAVKRNMDRFPEDFMFQLSPEEFESLRSQIVISKGKAGSSSFSATSQRRK
jgi:hypothetical protein